MGECFFRYPRRQFRETGECPFVFTTCRELGLRLRDLETLFPRGYLRGACRLAGIPYCDRFADYFREPSRIGVLAAPERPLTGVSSRTWIT